MAEIVFSMPHAIFIFFAFLVGSCVGSFLNVVVWRLPRVEFQENDGGGMTLYRSMKALSEPPSHCPKCEKLLRWYDNIPVLGWIKLGGKCRFCKEPISMRYPIVEAITGLIFAGYFWAFFGLQTGPCVEVMPDGRVIHDLLTVTRHWWLYALDMALLSGLLAASLIDAELFIIPMEIPWLIAGLAVVVHAIFDYPGCPGGLMTTPLSGALATGAVLGLTISLYLKHRGIFAVSFAPDPADEKKETEEEREWSPSEVRREIRKEMLFLLPPMFFAALTAVLSVRIAPLHVWWSHQISTTWLGGFLGSVMGGLVGGFVVWITRILGSIGFGKEAMGQGDIDLMVAVGAVLGAGPATVAFFLAPFFGIITSIWMLAMRKGRVLPYGPYLSLATAFVMLFYCPIAAYFTPGLANLGWMLSRLFTGGSS